MSTILFPAPIFGPVHSRRLGISLGINLLPADRKVCSFDCIYCECGYRQKREGTPSPLPTREQTAIELEQTLLEMAQRNERPDVITFAGNGEPTLHPDFYGIMQDVTRLRNQYAPSARVCVLSNATTLGNPKVVEGLAMCDEAILKIDAGTNSTIQALDVPADKSYRVENVAQQIIGIKNILGQRLAIQTMFASWTDAIGEHDNSKEEELTPWIETIRQIAPPRVMIYTIDRETPLKTMQKTPTATLDAIAKRVELLGCQVSVSY